MRQAIIFQTRRGRTECSESCSASHVFDWFAYTHCSSYFLDISVIEWGWGFFFLGGGQMQYTESGHRKPWWCRTRYVPSTATMHRQKVNAKIHLMIFHLPQLSVHAVFAYYSPTI